MNAKRLFQFSVILILALSSVQPAYAAPPDNDNFANAEIISSLPFSTTVDNTDATLEPNEVGGYCGTLFRSVWYIFTPTEDMAIRLSMTGSQVGGSANIFRATGPAITDLVSLVGCASNDIPNNSQLEAGQTYYIRVDSFGQPGVLQVNLQQIIPPANDIFANAEVISSLPFSTTVDNTNATLEPNEVGDCGNLSRSVWYTFTPTENMAVRLSMTGSQVGGHAYIFRATGPAITDLVSLGCVYSIDDIPINVPLEAGQTYYIRVDGGPGVLQINLQQTFPPVNDNFANAEVIPSIPFSTTVDNTNATVEFNEVEGCGELYRSVWYTFTPTEDMAIRLSMTGSQVGGSANIFQTTGPAITDQVSLGCAYPFNDIPYNGQLEAGQTYYIRVDSNAGQPGVLQINLQQTFPPVNDNFADATVISSPLPFKDSVDVSLASLELGEPNSSCAWYGSLWKTVWYAYTPTEGGLVFANVTGASFTPVLTIYTGDSMTSLTELGCQVFSENPIIFSAEAGTTYYFQVGKLTTWDPDGSVQFQLRELNPPPNDNFNNATAIGTLPFSNTVDITDATAEPDEPQYCYYSSRTVWYSFTPTRSGAVRADMAGSNFSDTILNIYRAEGPGYADLVWIQCTTDFGNSGYTTFSVQAGVTYYLQAGSYSGGAGDLQLNLQEIPPPANDDFVNARVISSPPFDDIVDTLSANTETGEPIPSCGYNNQVSRTVWYAFTPPTSGAISASVPSAAFTPVFAAYTGNSLASLSQVECRNYSGNLLTFQVNAGTTYYFQIGNLYPWEQGGSMQFHLDVPPPPVAGFYFYPYDPSVFDTIQFYDQSYDPAQLGIQSYAWDFGDGTTSSVAYPTHKYAADGDYTVQHSVTTPDGRSASTTQLVQVRTHDVAIVKVTAPNSANAGQTRTITVTVRNKRYPEMVTVDLYKSTPGGEVWVNSITLQVPVSSGNRTTSFSFSYTFTSQDAQVGKVTFRAVASISGARDAYPADNEGISSPPTKVAR